MENDCAVVQKEKKRKEKGPGEVSTGSVLLH